MCSRPLEYSTTRTLSWRSCERPGPEAEGEHSIEDKNDSQSLQVPFVSNTVIGILCFLSRLSRVCICTGAHNHVDAKDDVRSLLSLLSTLFIEPRGDPGS